MLLLALGAVDAFHHRRAGVRYAPLTSSASIVYIAHKPKPCGRSAGGDEKNCGPGRQKKGPDDKPEREKVTCLALVLLFTAPWKNPNSIFVYFILRVPGDILGRPNCALDARYGIPSPVWFPKKN